MTDFPIAVMSFNRPHYLAQVLDSLVAQTALGDRRVFLFQDNAVNDYSKRRHATDEEIAQSIDVFRQKVPHGKVMLAEHNLGVCENFLRAERFFFEELGSDAGYFFEDDMVLSPHYLAMLDRIHGFVATTDQVGYFAAYGKYDEPLEGQRERSSSFQRMDHHWAFAITRRHWLDMHAWLEPYYRFVVGTDYRQRPHADILAFFRARGVPLTGSAQDGIKKVATYALGRVSINTVACFARYIGAHGLHLRPEQYEARGYASTILFPEPVALQFPTPAELTKFHETEVRARWRRVEADRKARVRDTGAFDQKPEAAKSPVAFQPKTRAAQFLAKLYAEDIYRDLPAGFDAEITKREELLPALRRIIEEIRPGLILDLRAGRGVSTLRIAEFLRTAGIDGYVIAVDTFLGSPHQWSQSDPTAFAALRIKNGFPGFYFQFLSDVVRSGLQGYVAPLPQTADNAAVILRRLHVSPDIVHLNAAEHQTARDIRTYYGILRRGGCLIGGAKAKGSDKAAAEFAAANGLGVTSDPPYWILRKPA